MQFDDFYGENLGIKEFKYKNFKINKKKNEVTINDKYFGKKKGFLIFYSPFCVSCQDSVETWSSIAINNLNIFPIGAINCLDLKNKNDLLIPLLKISYYPMIKLVNNGKIEDIDLSAHNEDDIIFYINNNI